MKKIPKKNYIILAIVVLVVVFSAFYMRNWYLMANEYNSNHSPMLKVINEINPDEISNYTLEMPKFVLYTSSGLNKNIKNFESKFKNYVFDKNIKDYMIYINTADLDTNNLDSILNNYTTEDKKINVGDNVNMYIFDNSKIVKTINNANELSFKQINRIFKKYGVLDA